jgi:hypothetical protein
MFAEKINEGFSNAKEFIKARILNEVRNYLVPVPEHYEWVRGQCTYDASGLLRKDGLISLNQTLSDFLENEYTGTSRPSYESGHGFFYDTYGDLLSQFTFELASDYMHQIINSIIEDRFDVSLTEDDLFTIRDNCDDYAPIYDACIAYDFFWWEGAVDFCDIRDMKLSDIARKK